MHFAGWFYYSPCVLFIMKNFFSHFVSLLLITLLTATTGFAQRDAWQWPFDKTSIWNMPIGSEAVYVEADLTPSRVVGYDIKHMLELDADDPERPVLATYNFKENRCSSTDSLGLSLPIPDDFIVPDAGNSPYGLTPNSSFVLRLPDSDTVFEGGLLSRCTEAGPIHMASFYRWPNNRRGQSVYSDGLTDADGQGASGMSGLGGTLRRGELVGDQPIRHAIKINPWGRRDLYYSEEVPGYRWPAVRADSYANDPENKNQYLGTNPKLVMGSLLAIPPNVTEASLGLTTEAGRKLFFTLKYYGAYFTEDTAWDTYDLVVERDAEVEFEQEYGFSLESDPWKADFLKLIQALHVVDNNGPNSIGGGGEPLQPLAPDFEVPDDSTNRVINGSFEANGAPAQQIAFWNSWSSTDTYVADYVESNGNQTDGNWHLTHYYNQAGPWNCYTGQLITGLEDGTYTLRARARKVGQGLAEAKLVAKDFGGTAITTNVASSATMQPIEIENIQVSNGQCRIGLQTRATAQATRPSVHLDAVEFFRQGTDTSVPIATVAARQPTTVYPNPAEGVVRFNRPLSGVLFNVQGQPVDRLTNQQRYDVSPLRRGVYLLKTENSEAIRLVVEP